MLHTAFTVPTMISLLPSMGRKKREYQPFGLSNTNFVSVLQGSSPKNGVLISVLLSLANYKY